MDGLILIQILSKVLWRAFYRAHLFPMVLVLFVLVGIVQPPHLVLTGLFVRSLLLSPTASWMVGLFCLVWGLYASMHLVRSLGHSSLDFLVVCGSLANWKLGLLAWWNVWMAGLLGWTYLIIMGYHGSTIGFKFAWFAWGAAMIGPIIMGILLMKRLGGRLNLPWVDFRIPLNVLGLPGIFWRLSMGNNRLTFMVMKMISLAIVITIKKVGAEGILEQIVWLAFVMAGLVHFVLVFKLRQEEIAYMDWLKGLPVRGIWVWFSYMVVLMAWILPELLVLASGTLQGLPVEWLLMFAFVAIATQALGLGLTYLPQMSGRDFTRLGFGVFLVAFTFLVFSVPVWILYLFLMTSGMIAFAWGFKHAVNRLDFD
jgi:hypothetical protein